MKTKAKGSSNYNKMQEKFYQYRNSSEDYQYLPKNLFDERDLTNKLSTSYRSRIVSSSQNFSGKENSTVGVNKNNSNKNPISFLDSKKRRKWSFESEFIKSSNSENLNFSKVFELLRNNQKLNENFDDSLFDFFPSKLYCLKSDSKSQHLDINSAITQECFCVSFI